MRPIDGVVDDAGAACRRARPVPLRRGLLPGTDRAGACARIAAPDDAQPRARRAARRVERRARSPSLVRNAAQRGARSRRSQAQRAATRRSCCTASRAAARPRSTSTPPRAPSPRGGQVLLLVPEINLTPQLEARVRAALPGVRVVSLHSGLAAGARRANWEAAARGEARPRARHAARRLHAAAAARRSSSSTRSTTRRTSSRTACAITRATSRCWRAHQRGRAHRAGLATPSLETLANAREGRYRRLDLPDRADARARLPAVTLAPDRDARASDGIGPALRAAIARTPRARRAVAGVRQPARLRAVAQVRGLRLGGGLPALQRAPRAASRSRPRCDATTAAIASACRLRVPPAATSTSLPLGFGTQRLERSAARGVSRRAHRAHRPRHDARARQLRGDARPAWSIARSTSSSARRCSPRATTFRA